MNPITTEEKKPQAKAAGKNPLLGLVEQGQSAWLDYIRRNLLTSGELKRLIDNDGLRGITSNPAIFEKAIAGSTDYADILQELRAKNMSAGDIYEHIAIRDIQDAADFLRPVYEATNRRDGYVSLEVSPTLARKTQETIEEARRLWKTVGRENVMIKVPGTDEGVPAVRQLISEGININITLLFAQDAYEKVAAAYIAALEDRVKKGQDVSKLASVASFFVSRIDALVDTTIQNKLKTETDARKKELLTSLLGKIAIANAKQAYRTYEKIVADPRWKTLQAKGAQTQRLLWASTSTKNPSYRDVIYVEELIAPDTINTIPPATMDAFRDHGTVRLSLEEDIGHAKQMMAALDQSGISIEMVTATLIEEGVQLFADAFDKLLGAVARKRAVILGEKLDSQTYKLSSGLEKEVIASLESWRHDGNVRRLYAGDARLWTGSGEATWLGWLSIAEEEFPRTSSLASLAKDIRKQGFSHILLLGMGGSSLGAGVFAATIGRQNGSLELLVLDSTDPAQIRTIESQIDPARTLFLVSSKSGSTLEPNILKQYFLECAKKAVGADEVGSRFIAITDPGSTLQKMAKRERFRHIAFGIPSIGGRYSVLSDFGMLPAAAMGLDIGKFLGTTQKMLRSCGANVPPADNPGVVLGTVLGLLAKSGRDKATIVASPGIADFGAWLEQLLAESTGKHGKGIIPVDAEPLAPPDFYGEDRLFLYVRLSDEADVKQDDAVAALERAGHPVVRIAVTDRYHIGQEFFRWEVATAVAGAILGINPFDQPDVEASKMKTRELTTAYEKTGALPPETALLDDCGLTLFA